ncbi:hypothetical protein [Peribacillus frigoritolerans]|nr:hypothetical protein [Peribacillus frigoritolerans]
MKYKNALVREAPQERQMSNWHPDNGMLKTSVDAALNPPILC